MALSNDEIVTLFISFGWLNRRFSSEFATKRKNIIEFMRKRQKKKSFTSAV